MRNSLPLIFNPARQPIQAHSPCWGSLTRQSDEINRIQRWLKPGRTKPVFTPQATDTGDCMSGKHVQAQISDVAGMQGHPERSISPSQDVTKTLLNASPARTSCSLSIKSNSTMDHESYIHKSGGGEQGGGLYAEPKKQHHLPALLRFGTRPWSVTRPFKCSTRSHSTRNRSDISSGTPTIWRRWVTVSPVETSTVSCMRTPSSSTA